MACFQVDADVLAFRSQTLSDLTGRNTPGASSSTHPVPQDASKSLEAVHALFAAADASSHNEERPQKRRKIDADSRYASLSTSSHVDHSAVLAKVSIDLNFAPVVTSMSPNEGSPKAESPLVLSLESFSGPEASRSRIVLFDATSNSSIDILAAVDLESYQSVKPHIKAAESLACTKLGRKKTTKPRAAFARCILSSAPLTSHMYKLVIEVRWLLGISVVESPAVSAHLMKEDLRLLSTYFRSATAQSDARWALSDFYDSVYVPPVDLHISPQIQHKLVDTTLYPFQQRAVNWLLRREGVAYLASGHLEPLVENVAPASFNTAQDANGTTCYVSGLRGMVVTDLQAAEGDALQSLKGGILAEEMGLGKTVELIGLISHHKRQTHNDKVFDIHTGAHVRTSGATLIITPPSILEQWRSEIHTHAPNLKVLHYKGLPSSSAPKREHAAATVEELLRYDVVLTTYGVLSKEIHYATPPPDRSSRHERRHERRKSPLVDISWWRVCLDEAQMVESGVSNAARVARVIPRINAWAVSGTPLRKDIQDLRGLLTFLRCDTFAQNKLVWSRLDKSSFYAIFNQITLRHTKDKVRNDLRLPPQKRAVITIPFTAIEEQNYADLVRQMCDECWLGPEGEPLNADSDPSSPEILERMCEWLVRLRQTCLHAHVGRKNKRALGARNGPLRTVHEVLEIMIEQNSTRWKADARETILNRVKMGHVKAYAGNIENRAENALPFFTKALEETQVYVSMCRQDLEQEQRRLGVSATVLKHDEDSDAEEAEREDMGNIASLRRSLRSFLELEHMCKFFIATTHHQIKDYLDKNPGDTEASLREEQLETEWYDQAKTIRRELLREVKNTTQRQMNKIEKGKPFEQLPNVEELPDLGGIESRRVLETIDEVSDFLNAQAAKVQEWRTKIVDILLLRLTDDDDDIETTGEEYETSLKAQDELYVSIMALRTLVADRNLAVHGLQDHLINEELKTAIRHARDDDPEKRGHAPELLIEFSKQRAELMSTLHGGSLKGVMAELRSKIVPLQWRAENDDHRAAAESTVLQKHLSSVQSIMSQQIKALLEMEKEQEMFRATMNQRLEYYRQFQHISDTVAAYKEELDEKFDQAAFQIFDYRRSKSLEAVNTLKGKHAYLVNLRAEDQKSAATDCIICQETIEVGVLTTCGHKYCKECINQWWHAHRTCPLCKQKLKSSDFKDISLKPSELPTKADTPPSDSPPQAQASIPKTTDMSIYSDISETTLKEIKMIDLPGSYGSKIDMLAKHLLWIRANDPGAKSVIFSQYRDFLEVLESAFRDWKIVCSNIREKDGIVKFKRDPATEAFLLDAKSDSSGLNLVNATYVFLCEPLINPAIELQAIARVHRIGQQRPTTVFMYLISNTVEEAIYDISVARRLEHMKSSSRPAETSGAATPVAAQEKSLDKANSAEMEAAPLKQLLSKGGGGEAVKNDDLWQCLFGKPRKSPGLRSEEQMRVTVGL